MIFGSAKNEIFDYWVYNSKLFAVEDFIEKVYFFIAYLLVLTTGRRRSKMQRTLSKAINMNHKFIFGNFTKPKQRLTFSSWLFLFLYDIELWSFKPNTVNHYSEES